MKDLILDPLATNWSSIKMSALEMAGKYGLGKPEVIRQYFNAANIEGDHITGCPTNAVFAPNLELILSYLRSVSRDNYQRYTDLFNEERKFLAKIGPQGGNIPGRMIDNNFRAYLGQRVITDIPKPLIKVRDLLLRILRPIAVDEGYFTVNSRSAGGSFGGTKDVLSTVAQALADRYERPDMLAPNRAAARYQRGKIRILGNDDIMNVYKVDYILHAVKNHMRYTYPWFSCWLNPYSVRRRLIQRQLLKNRLFIEFDVTKMDRCLDIGVIRELVLPLYRALLSKEHYDTLVWYTELAFQQPYYVNGTLYTGWHAGLSGQMIISDFESWIVLLVNLAACLDAGTTYELLLVCGDDQLMSGAWTLAEAQRIQQSASSLAERIGLIMPLEKSRISHAPMILRHFWYPGHTALGDQAEGIYPATMGWNNIMFPENPVASPSEAVVSTISKADCFSNHPCSDTLLLQFWEGIQLPKHFNDVAVPQPGRNLHHTSSLTTLADVRCVGIGVRLGCPQAIRVADRVGHF